VWRRTTLAGLCFGGNISLLFLGVTETSVAHAEFIEAMTPLLMIPAGVVLFREHPNWKALRWGGLSLIGLMIVLLGGHGRGVATAHGDLTVVAAGVFFAAYLLLSKRIRAQGVGLGDFMSIVMPVAMVTATPVALATGGSDMWPLSGKGWAAVVMLSVLTGMLAHGLLYYAQRHAPIATISTIQTSQPAQATFWAWILLGESVTATQIPGMVLVTVGLVLVVWFGRMRAPAHLAPARSISTSAPGRGGTAGI
jgi:drug/metabolite transporter (DMT)-like permease